MSLHDFMVGKERQTTCAIPFSSFARQYKGNFCCYMENRPIDSYILVISYLARFFNQ